MIQFLLLYFFIFTLGLCIGSFLNCIIYRIEHKKTLSGRSFCPNCKHNLKWLDLFPVFSFLFLGGKCRYCKKKISFQYPLVEFSTGIVFILIFNWQIISSLFLFYIASVLILIFVYDLKHYIIPDKVLLPAIVIALVYRLIFDFYLFPYFFLAIIISAGFFLLIFLVSRGRWMGFGDVKLAVLMGLVLGAKEVLVALFLAFLFGAIIGVILMIFQKKGLKSEIPFGPFLITGTFLALIWGQYLINLYLSFILI